MMTKGKSTLLVLSNNLKLQTPTAPWGLQVGSFSFLRKSGVWVCSQTQYPPRIFHQSSLQGYNIVELHRLQQVSLFISVEAADKGIAFVLSKFDCLQDCQLTNSAKTSAIFQITQQDQHTRVLISAQKMSHKHNKDLSCLR